MAEVSIVPGSPGVPARDIDASTKPSLATKVFVLARNRRRPDRRLAVFLDACVRNAAGMPKLNYHRSAPGVHGVGGDEFPASDLIVHIAPRSIRVAPRFPPFLFVAESLHGRRVSCVRFSAPRIIARAALPW